MTDILFIKTSSLGDVIHHMPAVTEARRERPAAGFTWLVEAFVTQETGSQRIGMSAVLAFLAVGVVMMLFVRARPRTA